MIYPKFTDFQIA